MLDVREGSVRETHVDPAELGLARSKPEDLVGGDAEGSATIARAILAGEQGPRRDVVLLNAAAALEVAGAVSDLAAGLVMAAEAIDSGAGTTTLAAWVAASRNG